VKLDHRAIRNDLFMRLVRLCTIFAAAPLAAQSSGAPGDAAATITAPDVMRRVSIIADDSMMGRDTPSKGLELTAQYVAAEFRRAGLRPAGDSGGYIQRYGLTRWVVDTAASAVKLSSGRVLTTARVGTDARYIEGPIPTEPVRGQVVLLGESSAQGELNGRIVVLVADFNRPVSAALNQRVLQLATSGAKAVLILSNRDSLIFADRLRLSGRTRFTRDSAPESGAPVPIVELHERAVARVLAAAGIDPAQWRASAGSPRRVVSGLKIEISLAQKVLVRVRVPNVVGILDGSDAGLRQEYLAYSAHIDHIGVSPGQSDSVNNGADDNASGVAGLLELVEAFSAPGARPRRSLLFVAPSAEEPGLLGSAHFTEHPPVPLSRIVADINMDLIGRNWDDSVIAVGIEQSDLGSTLASVVGRHPELRMTPLTDRWPEERIFYRSDHYNFARKGVPILFFTSGTHADYHRPTDDVNRINGEKESRLVRLLFYLGAEIGNRDSRPQWNPKSYRQIVDRR
jgi:peptidase M28-like protein